MTIPFSIPFPETLDLWNKGHPITDDQLNELERFFYAMMKGSEALGERFSLATTALRREFNRADHIAGYRSQSSS